MQIHSRRRAPFFVWALFLGFSVLSTTGCGSERVPEEPPPDTTAFPEFRRPEERVVVVPYSGQGKRLEGIEPGDEIIPPPPMPRPKSPDLRLVHAVDNGPVDVAPEVVQRAWAECARRKIDEPEATLIRQYGFLELDETGRPVKQYDSPPVAIHSGNPKREARSSLDHVPGSLPAVN
jgi:hypothetical protein